MKSSCLIKTVLMALPAVVLIYVFLIRDWIDVGDGIGGGSYDLTKMYVLVIMGVYLLILNLALLIQDAGGNRHLVLTGILLLIVVVVMGVRSF